MCISIEGKGNRRKRKYFGFLLCLYLFYYSYRYIFKYNSRVTSPTYGDTPLLFQIIKYIILSVIIVLLIINAFMIGRIRYKSSNELIFYPSLFLIAQFLSFGIIAKNADAVAFALIVIPCVFYMGGRDRISLKACETIFCTFWWFTLAYELIQIGLYFKLGRLPALAYPTGRITDVRFGGAWDDPNGYALLMIFYIFYFLVKYRTVRQLFYVGASAFMLLLTWSGTGIIALGVTSIVILLIRLNDKSLIKKYTFYVLAGIIMLAAILAMRRDALFDTLNYYLASKQGSIAQHLAGTDISQLDIMTLIGIKPDYMSTEVGFYRCLSIGGVPALVALFCIANKGCSRCIKELRSNVNARPLIYGIFAYLTAFIVSEVNLPHVSNFSCMGLFICMIIIVVCASNDGVAE